VPTTLERYAWLSIAAAAATITLKMLAWWLTGSLGMLSDALESLVNLAAALFALSMLRLAAAPWFAMPWSATFPRPQRISRRPI